LYTQKLALIYKSHLSIIPPAANFHVKAFAAIVIPKGYLYHSTHHGKISTPQNGSEFKVELE
jgi:hypothetical protein